MTNEQHAAEQTRLLRRIAAQQTPGLTIFLYFKWVWLAALALGVFGMLIEIGREAL